MAVIGMGGPDRPPTRRVVKPKVPRVRLPKAKKPKKRKTTPGKIVYRTPRPPSRPTVIPAKSPTAMPTGPAAPKPPPTMLDRWRELGLHSQVSQYEQMKNEGRAHQAYVTDKVMPWLSNSLNLLNAYNTDAQNTMLGGIQGASGAYGVSAAMTPMNVASNAPGGAVVGPNSYLTEAGRQQALGTGNVATALANAQAALNKMQPVSLSQGYINALADKAAGLPAFYTKRSNDYAAGINQFIAESQAAAAEAAAEQAQWEAEFTEKSRHNRVSEAISATNSQTNAAIQLGRLGLDASDQAFDNQPGAPPPTNLPPGVIAVPTDDGGWTTRKDPTYQNPRAGKPSTKGKFPANQLRKEGFVPLPKGAGAKWVKQATRATDGSLWIKKGKVSGGSGSPGTRDSAFSLSESLLKTFGREGDGGLADTRFPDDPQGGGKWIASWVREKKSQFVGKNRRVDLGKLMAVLDSIGGRPGNIALDILQRGYMKKVGGVWYWK
jgi:hypothetical protein